jgi:voltage-gated potassium channel Kch
MKEEFKKSTIPLIILSVTQYLYYFALGLTMTFIPAWFPAILLITTIPLLIVIFKIVKSSLLDRSHFPKFQLGYYILLFIIITLQFDMQYELLQAYNSESFFVQHSSGSNSIDFLYFSIVTIATVGYGDITPVTTTAKILTSIEILTGIVFLIIIISNFRLFFKSASEK